MRRKRSHCVYVCLCLSQELINDMLEMESAFPNMDHPDFVSAATKAQRQLHGEVTMVRHTRESVPARS